MDPFRPELQRGKPLSSRYVLPKVKLAPAFKKTVHKDVINLMSPRFRGYRMDIFRCIILPAALGSIAFYFMRPKSITFASEFMPSNHFEKKKLLEKGGKNTD